MSASILGACTPATPPAPATPTPAAEVEVDAPAMLGPRAIVSTVEVDLQPVPVACGWGSTGVVAAEGPIPYWVIGLVDITPPVTADPLELRRLQLYDAEGRSLGEADREFELRVAAPDRDGRDFSRHGTTPLDTPLAAGQTHRLWFRARMSDAFEPGASPPARYSLILGLGPADAGIEGPVGAQWPTG